VVFVSVAVALGVFELTASGATITPRAAAATATQPPEGFEANSTQAVCALTGSHGAYKESSPKPGAPTYTQTDY